MEASPPPKKRRIPKACKLCRTSKLKCDGGKPCTRCRTLKIDCDYVMQEEDPMKQKLERIEAQMEQLSNRIPDTATAVALLQLQQQQQQQQQQNLLQSPYSAQFSQQSSRSLLEVTSPSSHRFSHGSQQSEPFRPGSLSTKRKRGDYEVTVESGVDMIRKRLLSYDDAKLYFTCFFQGCDKYVPLFDPTFDTFESVRERSVVLFDTICTIGCRAEHGPLSAQFQILSNANKSSVCDVILGNIPASIEAIQALLINASYSEKGWMMTSMATRMALDLDLPKAYHDLTMSALSSRGGQTSEDAEIGDALFRRARVWFGTFVLEHIMSLDCGKKPGVVAVDGMRRCRVLLSHPSMITLDLRLMSQVELNSIRALAQERLSPAAGTTLADQELSEIVQGTRIDLNIWLNDWVTLVETHATNADERAILLVNLRIQKDWAEMTMLCKGLQGIGDNVALMTEEQQNLIHLARIAAENHLSIMISSPDKYLATFRYGMDFVWAKCAFSVLLALKLARLFPSTTDMPALVSNAKILVAQLSKARGSNNIYFRILCLTVEKCEQALKEDQGWGTSPDANSDFQNYAPKEFIQEWNFPGLNLCWIPFDFQDMFLDFASGF